MSNDIQTLVVECVQQHCHNKNASITSETKLRDLEIESLDFVEIIFDLEEALDIEIAYNANEAESILTVNDLSAKVIEIVQKQAADKVGTS